MRACPRKPRGLRTLLVLAIGAVVLHLAATAWTAWDLHRADEDLVAHHRPMIPAQVIPVVSDQDNAAFAYTRAMVLLSLDSGAIYTDRNSGKESPAYERIDAMASMDTHSSTPVPTVAASIRTTITMDPASWTGPMRKDAWTVLAGGDFMRIRAALLEGASKPACAFPVAWDEGPNCVLPMLNPLRQLVRLVCCHALLSQEHGDDQAMHQDFAIAMQMAVHCRQIPLMMAYLVSVSLERNVIEAISVALSHAPLGDMSAVQQQLSRMVDWPQAARDLDTERVVLGGYFFSAEHAPYYGNLVMTPLRLFEQATYSRTMGIGSNALEAGAPMPVVSVPHLAVITRMLLPALSMFDASVSRAARTRAMALTALALEDWKRTHGAYPTRLADLAPNALAPGILERIPFVIYSSDTTSWTMVTTAGAMAGHEVPVPASLADMPSRRTPPSSPVYAWHSAAGPVGANLPASSKP